MIVLLFVKKWTIIKVVLPTFFYKKLVFGPFLRVELLDLTEKTATSSSSTGYFGHSARSSSSACYPAVLAPVLAHLINSSQKAGIFPGNAKLARVISVYKNKGDKHVYDNYTKKKKIKNVFNFLSPC